jgi:hypothetical protein
MKQNNNKIIINYFLELFIAIIHSPGGAPQPPYLSVCLRLKNYNELCREYKKLVKNWLTGRSMNTAISTLTLAYRSQLRYLHTQKKKYCSSDAPKYISGYINSSLT